jgi:hypothetical protein
MCKLYTVLCRFILAVTDTCGVTESLFEVRLSSHVTLVISFQISKKRSAKCI